MKLPKRLSIKLFAENPEVVETATFVPVMQKWIQRDAIQGELLIDVVDYKHVHHGPGVILIGHESDYGYDLAEGRPGLLYTIKNYNSATLPDLLILSLSRAVQAAKLMQGEMALNGLKFSVSELQIKLLDRLNYPYDKQVITQAEEVITAALITILGHITAEPYSDDARDPIGFTVKVSEVDDLDTLSSKLPQTTTA